MKYAKIIFMKKILTSEIALLIIATLVTASAILFLYPYEPKQPPKANETGWTQEGVQAVVNANNKFALELYSELSKEEQGNIFYSPYSIFSAFAMTYEGARGQTAEEIKSVFHFPDYSVLRPNFAAVYNDINEASKFYELRTGNALWVQKDYPLLEDYVNRVEEYYGGKAANLDFINEPEKSRQTINSFIEEQTNGKIKNLIPPGSFNPLTRLVLTNAIYFKGLWKWQFDPKDTKERDFYVTPTNKVKVPMMCMEPEKAEFNYADTTYLQILELPYRGEKISMLILLPKENLKSIEPLTIEKLSEYKSKMKKTKLRLICIPKFEFDTKYNLNENLKDLGMPTAFKWPGADFSGMDGTKMLYIDKAIHQAYIKVDERGTEAAAATTIVIGFGSALPLDMFIANRPFIFIIQQKDTGNILFLGRIVDPTQ